MMRRVETAILLLFLLMLTEGCRQKRPDGVLSPRKMEAVLYDYHLAQAVVMELPRDERYARDAYLDWCFEKNGITKEQFDNSLKWYTRYPKELALIYEDLSARIDKEYEQVSNSVQLAEKKALLVASGDSVDIWYLNRVSILNTSDYMKKLVFSFPADTTFYPSDTIEWYFAHTFVETQDSVPHKAYLELSVYYPDSVSTIDTMLCSTGHSSLSLVIDTVKPMTRISGSVNYLDQTDDRKSLFILSDVSLLRFHKR
ncbi:MAG: DUF4296 domain-containing protein [Bacteroidaceae bacterium]|nr:DUF4296 domain-containing protein [Bacteroidaceae bacterium]